MFCILTGKKTTSCLVTIAIVGEVLCTFFISTPVVPCPKLNTAIFSPVRENLLKVRILRGLLEISHRIYYQKVEKILRFNRLETCEPSVTHLKWNRPRVNRIDQKQIKLVSLGQSILNIISLCRLLDVECVVNYLSLFGEDEYFRQLFGCLLSDRNREDILIEFFVKNHTSWKIYKL